ncbi:MAG: hypothetical protein E4G98_07235 [Promethearchaeota archaeon]|nr:MAG: hypothetical protein E4G98_07235 [Candidatus Lokiarchaeota archaeon]
MYEFQNSDDFLKEQTPKVMEERKKLGLEGLVKGLNAVIINTEIDLQKNTVKELLSYTGLHLNSVFEDDTFRTAVLTRDGSASFLVRARLTPQNPFKVFNDHPKSKVLPNTRLECFVFDVPNLAKYVEIQHSKGVRFTTPEIIDTDNYAYIQSQPSNYIGTSYGYIQSHHHKDYHPNEFREITNWNLQKPDYSHLKNIYELDHTATRVKAEERDTAIIEFMRMTNYHFDFAIYVKHLNSITNVARLSANEFAMVFTSGITPFQPTGTSGPTEKFTYNYGPRVHHMAFRTEHIDETYVQLRETGMEFLVELVGSEEEGLKQTFSAQSPSTMIVNEYIHRFGDFDGFFTKSNVTDLTRATEKQ